MSLSERERKVLERLEGEFGTPSTSAGSSPTFGIPTRWSSIGVANSLAVAAVTLPAGLLLLALGLALSDAGGIALAVLGYVLLTGGVTIVVGCTARIRTGLVRLAKWRPESRSARY